jgi:sulfonate transport system substrate-binding protein
MRKFAFALAALLLLGLTCPSAIAQSTSQKVIRFAYQKNLFVAPVFVAFEKNWFDEALAAFGYRMERKEIGIGPAVAKAMAADQIDIGQLGLSVAVESLSSPGKISRPDATAK